LLQTAGAVGQHPTSVLLAMAVERDATLTDVAIAAQVLDRAFGLDALITHTVHHAEHERPGFSSTAIVTPAP
jgi:hypothetical protein